MTLRISNATVDAIELLLIQQDHRGMSRIRQALNPGYLGRAAELLRAQRGIAYIITGFPVAGSFETDGPAGAMALYRLCEQIQLQPVIVSEHSLTQCLAPTLRCLELAAGTREEVEQSVRDLYKQTAPALIISIERPGAAKNGRYYNMAGVDISANCSPAEPYLELAPCPIIAIGDGGNELGMGKAIAALEGMDIHPAICTCDELIVADVSNWGAYALCALTYAQHETIPDISAALREDLAFLVAAGAVDGVTGKRLATEDGFPADAGAELVDRVIELLHRGNEL